MLAGCITQPVQPVYSEWPPVKAKQRHFLNQPVEPPQPDINPAHAKPRLMNTAFNIVVPVKPQLQIDAVLPPAPTDSTTLFPPDGVDASAFIWVVYSATNLSAPNWAYEPVSLIFNDDGSVTREVFTKGRHPLFFKAIGIPKEQTTEQPGNQ